MNRTTVISVPRRRFLANVTGALAAAPLTMAAAAHAAGEVTAPQTAALPKSGEFPVRVISSANGLAATRTAYDTILKGGDTLDACIAGVNLVEDDPNDTSVGYGGLPNEDGVVELDAAVMHGPTHLAGAVAALQKIKNPSKVAKLVMEQTDHVLLVGEGALKFARAHGFKEEELLTEKARKIWLYWRQSRDKDDDWIEPPDEILDPEVKKFFKRPTGTIHCAGMNAAGDISCTTTTSGLAFKLAGRVGDSPIIGAGLYVDNAIGSCGSTGRGEANLQNLSCSTAVELMRGGRSPQDAGMEMLRRIAANTAERLRDKEGRPNFDLTFYLLAKNGDYVAVSMWGPAKFAITDAKGTRHEDCESLYQRAAK
ncbi:MAG: N(4)-(beta-N-acetylglucosaminyl)-L-asparaginase, partial [Pirellulales bacterium]